MKVEFPLLNLSNCKASIPSRRLRIESISLEISPTKAKRVARYCEAT